MLAQIGKFLGDRPPLMMYLALVMALGTILIVMWAFGEWPESSTTNNNLNTLREGVKIPRQ